MDRAWILLKDVYVEGAIDTGNCGGKAPHLGQSEGTGKNSELAATSMLQTDDTPPQSTKGKLGMKTVITFGTFDVFHIGHLNILRRARALGDRLIVGVSTDQLNVKKKGRPPVYSERDRMTIVASLDCVDEVFPEESLEWKGQYIQAHNGDVLVMGDDWEGRFDMYKELCEVVYLPRTENISTTEIIASIRAIS